MGWSDYIFIIVSVISTIVESVETWVVISLVWGALSSGEKAVSGVENIHSTGTQNILTRLLGLISSCGEEQENIVGDLLEEFNEFPSRVRAHLWLYKQVLKSVLPLIYKTAKTRLASYLGERVR
jgi:phage-related protein